MSKYHHERGYALKQTKRFWARQWRGRLVCARVRQQLTCVATLCTLATLLFVPVFFTTVRNAWARPLLVATAPPLGTAIASAPHSPFGGRFQTARIPLSGDDTTPLQQYTCHMKPFMTHDAPHLYQFRIRENLDDDLAAWFSPLVIGHEPNGTTTLTGPVRDQAELHGMLIKIRDLNLTLLSVINQ